MQIICIIFFVIFSVSGIAIADVESIPELINNNQYSLAETKLHELLLTDPSNITYLNKLSDVYISQNKFGEAKEICLKMLEKQPNDFDITLKISRINSWMGKFRDSINYYNKTIDTRQNDITPYIEKARVLGWWGKYGRADDAYLQTYEKFQEEWIKSESGGKKNLWNGKLDSAINDFEKSLDNKPDNSEILFDLAQIYSYGEDYKRADKYYSRLIDVNPYHTAAVKSRLKNQIQTDALSMNNGINRWDAQSLERNTNVEVTSVYLDISKKFNNIKLGTNFSREFMKFEDTQVEQNSVSLSASYQKPLVFGIGSGITKRNLLNIEKDRESYYAFAWYRLFERVNINANVSKNNMILNYGNIENNLNDTSNSVKVEYQAKNFFLIGSGLRAGKISDGNLYQINNIYAKFLIMKNPGNLYTILERENIQYDKKSTEYFAPGNYSNISSLTGYRHDIGKEGQYYGADQIYYELKYKLIYDSNNEIAHQPSAEFYVDLNNKLNLGMKYSMTTSTYYDDNSSYLQLKYIF